MGKSYWQILSLYRISHLDPKGSKAREEEQRVQGKEGKLK